MVCSQGESLTAGGTKVNSEVFFDFDYHTSFNELGIDIEGSMSTGGSNATYIYGSETTRLRETDFEGFEYHDGSYDFSSKAKLILEEDEMTLVKNQNGDIYLIDWVDSLRNYEDGIDGVKLRYRIVHAQQLPEPGQLQNLSQLLRLNQLLN